MARIEPLDPDTVPGLREKLKIVEAMLGFVPNSTLVMARRPELLAAFQQLGQSYADSGEAEEAWR